MAYSTKNIEQREMAEKVVDGKKLPYIQTFLLGLVVDGKISNIQTCLLGTVEDCLHMN